MNDTSEILNVGIVGLGKMGLLHAGILNSMDSIKIAAITEKEKIISNYVKDLMPDIKVFEDSGDMINNVDLDMVYVTTPVSSHLPIALLCVKNNVNFFVEKPLTKSIEESKKLCDELRNSSIIHSVGYNRRFIDTFAKAKSFLDENILGKILTVKSSMYVSNVFSRSTGWRSKKSESGGGVLLDLGSHVIDLLLWYFGKINKVSGEMRSSYSNEVEDFAHMKIEFSNNIKAELDTSWSVPGYRIPELNIHITGTNGLLSVNEDFVEIKLKENVSYLPNTNMMIYKQSLNKGVPIDLGGPEYTKEDMHFVECVRERKQTMINIFEASKTQSVIDAMYKSIEKGRQGVEYIE